MVTELGEKNPPERPSETPTDTVSSCEVGDLVQRIPVISAFLPACLPASLPPSLLIARACELVRERESV